ncbi:MAG: hypothetical protein IPG50_21530 [Myxococcales bacterium]|nr:hypothetical protein [Myxococcales bacterium]
MLGARRAFVVATACVLAACQRTAPSEAKGVDAPSAAATVSVAKPTPAMSAAPDLAWHNLSFFHGDGERLAFARDGRVFYERLKADRLLRWEVTLEASDAATLAAIHTRLSSAGAVVPERMGIPDEVSVLVDYRDSGGKLQRVTVWEADLGKLPPGHVVSELRGAVMRVGERIARLGPGTPVGPDAAAAWPPAFPAR